MNAFQQKHCVPPAYKNQPAADGFVLGGIISFGKGCGRRGTPGVYTNLYQPAIRNWSLEKIRMYNPDSIWYDQTSDANVVQTTAATTTVTQTQTQVTRTRRQRMRKTRKPRPSWKEKRERKLRDRNKRRNRRRYV